MSLGLGAFAMSDSEPQKKRGLWQKTAFSAEILNSFRGIQSHSLLIGKVTFYWNAVHAGLLNIFIQLAGEKDEHGRIDPTLPTRIWHDQGGDSAQRSLLLVFVEIKLSRNPAVSDCIKWALNELGTLAMYRNDATHVPFTITFGSKSARGMSQPNMEAAQQNRFTRLNSVGHRKLFRALVHDLFYLGEFLWALLQKLEHPRPSVDARPLPDRPVLRARALVEGSPPKSNGRPGSP